MKLPRYSDYDPYVVSQTIPALLTVWPTLGSYHSELVVVGGLVPQLICTHPTAADHPRAVTVDLDLGIALGASAGQYGTLETALAEKHFRRSEKQSGRYERKIGKIDLFLDLLVEYPGKDSGAVKVDDALANVMPGIARALETAKEIEVKGMDLLGAEQSLVVRVCDIGPYLVLKLRAFLRRQATKDAFDFNYCMRHYSGGQNAAAAAFAEEMNVGNPAMPEALKALELFTDENKPGPIYASSFVHGDDRTSDTREIAEQRVFIEQDAVSSALHLTKAVFGSK